MKSTGGYPLNAKDPGFFCTRPARRASFGESVTASFERGSVARIRVTLLLLRRHVLAGVLALVAAGVSPLSLASDFPGGANTTGLVTQTISINGMLLFVVQGTVDNGTSGSQAFWIDSTASGGSLRVANILSAAAQGRTVSIWNYGDTYVYGGQGGYLSQGEFVYY